MQGTAEKHRMEARGPELELPGSAPEPYSWMCAAAKREWKRLLSVSAYSVVISDVDKPVLAAFCEVFAEFEKSRKAPRRGEKRPEFQVSKLTAMINLAGKLGLTPSDRARIQVPDSKPAESRWAKLKANG